ncbi:MAG: hypothetical protein WDZ41_02800 [Candidatus Babeliales bacterium]
MINIRTIEYLISILTIAVAYVFSATTAGYMQAWAAKKLGDDTPEKMGFLTWNPLVHIDPIGAFCLFFLGIGWGKFIPMHPESIQGNFRLLLLFLAKPFTYIGIAFLSLLALLPLFGIDVLNLAMMMVLSDYISLATFTKIYPESSSLVLAVALILVMLIYIGVMFAVLNFIMNIFRYITLAFAPFFLHRAENDLLMFFIPFILMVLCARPLKIIVVYGITYSAHLIAPFIGAS